VEHAVAAVAAVPAVVGLKLLDTLWKGNFL